MSYNELNTIAKKMILNSIEKANAQYKKQNMTDIDKSAVTYALGKELNNLRLWNHIYDYRSIYEENILTVYYQITKANNIETVTEKETLTEIRKEKINKIYK